MTTNTTAIVDTISVATSIGSMVASHTGLGVYEYGISMWGNTIGVSPHREPFSYTPWGFPEHGGFWASYNRSATSYSVSTIAMKYINTLHSIITIGSSYIFRNNYDTYLQFHIIYCRDVIQHKVQVTTSQLHVMLLV